MGLNDKNRVAACFGISLLILGILFFYTTWSYVPSLIQGGLYWSSIIAIIAVIIYMLYDVGKVSPKASIFSLSFAGILIVLIIMSASGGSQSVGAAQKSPGFSYNPSGTGGSTPVVSTVVSTVPTTRATIQVTTRPTTGITTVSTTAIPTTSESGQALKSVFTLSPKVGSAPLNVQFMDRSTGNPVRYEWTFGDSSTSEVSSDANPTHTYDKIGQYVVQQIVYSKDGKMDFSRQTIQVTESVNAQFVDQAVGKTEIKFWDMSMGGPVKWHWDFGDGSESDFQNPGTHKYPRWGTYQVTLTVWNKEGKSDTFTKSCGTQ